MRLTYLTFEGRLFLISVLLLTAYHHCSGQSGCKMGGDYNKLLDELHSRNTQTGPDKLDQDDLKSMAEYWKIDCECRQGVETMEEAKKLYQKAFSAAKAGIDDSYLEDGVWKKKDMSNFGDLKPPFVIFTVSSCLNGNSSQNFGSDMSDLTDCTPESSILEDVNGQLLAYASHFFGAYCQCKNGVPTQEYATTLINTMQANYNHFQGGKGSDVGDLPQPFKNCRITGTQDDNGTGTGGDEKFSYLEDDIIGADLRSLVNDVAENSNNQELKDYAMMLNQAEKYSQKRDQQMSQYYRITGVDPPSGADEMDQFIDNSLQVVATAAFVMSLFIDDDEDVQEDPAVKQGKVALTKMVGQLNGLHRELKYLPYLSPYEISTLDSLASIEQQLYRYESATVYNRYLVLKYRDKAVFTIDDLNSELERIQGVEKSVLLQEIQDIQNEKDLSEFPYLLNANGAFRTQLNDIQLLRIRTYRTAGNEDKASQLEDDYLASHQGEVATEETFELLREYLSENEWGKAMDLLPSIRLYFRKGLEGFELFDSYSIFEIQDITRLLFNAMDEGNESQLASDILLLKNAIYDSEKTYYSNWYDQLKTEAILYGLEALYSVHTNDVADAEEKLEMAFRIAPEEVFQNYPMLNYVKLKVLLAKGEDTEHATRLYNDLSQFDEFLTEHWEKYGYESPYNQIEIDAYIDPIKLKYIGARLSFDKGEFQNAMEILDKARKLYPENTKYKALHYRAQRALEKTNEGRELLSDKYPELSGIPFISVFDDELPFMDIYDPLGNLTHSLKLPQNCNRGWISDDYKYAIAMSTTDAIVAQINLETEEVVKVRLPDTPTVPDSVDGTYKRGLMLNTNIPNADKMYYTVYHGVTSFGGRSTSHTVYCVDFATKKITVLGEFDAYSASNLDLWEDQILYINEDAHLMGFDVTSGTSHRIKKIPFSGGAKTCFVTRQSGSEFVLSLSEASSALSLSNMPIELFLFDIRSGRLRKLKDPKGTMKYPVFQSKCREVYFSKFDGNVYDSNGDVRVELSSKYTTPYVFDDNIVIGRTLGILSDEPNSLNIYNLETGEHLKQVLLDK